MSDITAQYAANMDETIANIENPELAESFRIMKIRALNFFRMIEAKVNPEQLSDPQLVELTTQLDLSGAGDFRIPREKRSFTVLLENCQQVAEKRGLGEYEDGDFRLIGSYAGWCGLTWDHNAEWRG